MGLYEDFDPQFDWYQKRPELEKAIEEELERCEGLKGDECLDGLDKLWSFVDKVQSFEDPRYYDIIDYITSIWMAIHNAVDKYPNAKKSIEIREYQEMMYEAYKKVESDEEEDCMHSFFYGYCDGKCGDCDWWAYKLYDMKNRNRR